MKNLFFIVAIFIFGGLLGWLMIFGFFYFQNSYFSNSQNSNQENLNQEKVFVKNENESEKLKVVAFITPHHLAAEDLIKQVFQKTAEENKNLKIDRIVLISPNHFNAGGGNFIVSDQDWEIENSKILAEKNLIEKLRTEKLVYLQNDIFFQEHGITALLPFVKKNFPEIPIIPLIIREKVASEEIDKLADFFSQQKGNTLMILSSDFSHELDKNISYFHDKMAIDTVQNFDFNSVANLETDCTSGLRLILQFSQKKNYRNFQLLANSNSSEIYQKFFIGENTSYVTGQFVDSKNSTNQNSNSTDLKLSDSKLTEENDRPISFLFGGDVMLDREVRKNIAKNSGVNFLTEKINRLFWAQDFNFINLEGAITSNESVSNVAMNNPNHFRFTFDRQNSQDFFNFNRINLVSGANNHILNFGQSGEEETKKFLEEQKIAYFGMPSGKENNSVIQEIKGKKIGFVAYNYSAGLSEVEVIAEIEKMKKTSDFVVVSAHWGLEYHLQESVVQKDLAHKFIDSGADLVIGSHPHVVQPIEIYKNKVIFYSLGNLVFDQYFDDDVRQRLMVGAVWEENKIGFYLVPLIADKSSKLELMSLDLRNKFLERIAKDSSVDEEIKVGIKTGKFEVRN